jgi:hypothetical protein
VPIRVSSCHFAGSRVVGRMRAPNPVTLTVSDEIRTGGIAVARVGIVDDVPHLAGASAVA